jgi:hypothetical protein
MTSALQEQLQRIAAAAGITPSKTIHGKPSLLFTFQEAADKGIQDIYEISLQGTHTCAFSYIFLLFRLK